MGSVAPCRADLLDVPRLLDEPRVLGRPVEAGHRLAEAEHARIAGGIVGAAVGMGAYGLRPVCEIQFADYFYPASDQIVSEGARLRYRSAGQFTAPTALRA